jgi:hypothetical protein
MASMPTNGMARSGFTLPAILLAPNERPSARCADLMCRMKGSNRNDHAHKQPKCEPYPLKSPHYPPPPTSVGTPQCLRRSVASGYNDRKRVGARGGEPGLPR